MIKVSKKLKKIIYCIMLALVLINSFNLNTFAAYITDMNSDAQFGVISGSLNDYKHELHYANYDGQTYIVFCCQRGVTSPNGGTYQYNSDFLVKFNNDAQAYRKIAQYIYFGYTMKYGYGLPTTTEAKRAACATQQFVWEYVYNNIDKTWGIASRNSWNPTYMSESIYSNWLSNTESLYNSYHNSNVSFNGQTEKVNIGESKTISDSNGVLASYPSFEKTINGVTFKHDNGNNNLVIIASTNAGTTAQFSSSANEIYRLLPNGAKYDKNTMSSYMYIKFSSGSVQDLLFSNYVDPTYFGLNVEVQSGKILLKKVNNIGNAVADCKFELYSDKECNNKVGNATTNSNGEILFDKLKPMEYYIKEISVAQGYLLDTQVKKVNVTSGNTTQVEFKNNEPTGEIKIYKVNKNGDPVGNAEFTIKANEDIKNVAKTKTFFKKGDVVAKIVSDKTTGIAKLADIPLGQYVVYESNAPKRLFIK